MLTINSISFIALALPLVVLTGCPDYNAGDHPDPQVDAGNPDATAPPNRHQRQRSAQPARHGLQLEDRLHLGLLHRRCLLRFSVRPDLLFLRSAGGFGPLRCPDHRGGPERSDDLHRSISVLPAGLQ